MMASVLGNALNAYVLVVCLAVKLVGLVMNTTKLMVSTNFLLMAGKL